MGRDAAAELLAKRLQRLERRDALPVVLPGLAVALAERAEGVALVGAIERAVLLRCLLGRGTSKYVEDTNDTLLLGLARKLAVEFQARLGDGRSRLIER